MSKIKPTKGFTLLEVVIVIIIIAVLTALALPQLSNMIEASRAAEAIAMIGQIRAAMERHYLMHNGSYLGSKALWYDNAAWENLGMGNPSFTPGAHFKYTVYDNPIYPDSYYIAAQRKTLGAPAAFGGDCYYICMGFGVRPTVSEDGVGSCSVTFAWLSDGKIYWDGEQRVSAFLPRTGG
jgi:prepilin-type N-terminal cleavage/methylation domain-containing protein